MGEDMKKFFLPLFAFLFLLFPPVVFAHPGRTAADGCHYCRTNCDYWGVPWNTRHCHDGTAPAPPLKVEPTPTPKITVPVSTPTPTPKPSPSPTPTPISTPSPTLSPTLSPTPMPSPESQLTSEVKGTATQEVQPISTAETIGAFGTMGMIGWGAYRLLRRFIVRKKP